MPDQRTESRDGSVDGGTPVNQIGRGGSIPASSLFFHAGLVDDAAELVKRYHYSRRMPSNIQFIGTLHTPGGLFGTAGDCQCACIFSIPPTRWSEPVLELSRLVRRDEVKVPLTLLIRLTVARIKASQLWNLLVSFADNTQGHHGGIYQASGWNFDGMRDPRMDGIVVDGELVAGRTANHRWGTQSPEQLATRGVTATAHFDDGKYLYWRTLNQDGSKKARRLGLREKRYPKPQIDPRRV